MKTTTIINCTQCNTETANPKFCSKSCAAIYINKAQPRRRRETKCIKCDSLTKSYRHNKCEAHWEAYRESVKVEKFQSLTLGEYRNRLSITGKHPSWVNTHVRSFARAWLSHLRELPCAHCGYDKHVELAHIKGISSYPDSALMGEVNSESNVIQLCRNCHWEFDNLPRKEKAEILVGPDGLEPPTISV